MQEAKVRSREHVDETSSRSERVAGGRGAMASWRYSSRRNARVLKRGQAGRCRAGARRLPRSHRGGPCLERGWGTTLRCRIVIVAAAIRSARRGRTASRRPPAGRQSRRAAPSARSRRSEGSARMPTRSAPWATACAQPLLGDVPAQVLLPEVPGETRSPQSRTLPAAAERPCCRGRRTRRAPAPRSCGGTRVGPALAQADAQTRGHPVAEAGQQVVVHAAPDPGRERGIGGPVPDHRVVGAEHPGQLGRQVVERAVGRYLEVGLLHLPPVRRRHVPILPADPSAWRLVRHTLRWPACPP